MIKKLTELSIFWKINIPIVLILIILFILIALWVQQSIDHIIHDNSIAYSGSYTPGITLALKMMISGLFCLVGIGVLGRFLFNYTFNRAFIEMQYVMELVGMKDFTKRMHQPFNDERHILEISVNTVIDNTRESLQQVLLGANQVSAQAELLGQSLNETRYDIELQSTKASEIAASSNEMSAAAASAAENVSRISESAKMSASIAVTGKTAVEKATVSINQTACSAKELAGNITDLMNDTAEIVNIVSIINDIADQTNLLALNAAIEAARAGELGRGFAVVADEVRKLAEKTTAATKDVSSKINNIQVGAKATASKMQDALHSSSESTSLMDSVNEVLENILQSSNRISNEIAEMTVSSQQQNTAIDEIVKDIDSVSVVAHKTMQSTALLSKIYDSLISVSGDLNKMVNEYRLLKTEA